MRKRRRKQRIITFYQIKEWRRKKKVVSLLREPRLNILIRDIGLLESSSNLLIRLSQCKRSIK
jgi:hypothetical protein